MGGLLLLASCYPFNLSLKPAPMHFLARNLGDYTGSFVITYKDDTTAGPYYPGDLILATGKIIKRITFDAGAPILIGRPDTDAINLNIQDDGSLDFRDPDGDGYIPIGSYAEFQMIDGDDPGKKYRLEADLDLMGENWTGVGKWSPVDLGTGTDTPIFDGNGKSIRNLYVSVSGGLFGSVESMSKVENVHVRSGIVTAVASSTVGGIAGTNSGTIEDCSNAASIAGSASSNIGGIAGSNSGGTITACYNTGTVSASDANSNVGGVAGTSNGNITDCYNTGAVSGDGDIGGVAGANYRTITACYNTGAVSGTGDVGGVVGYNDNGTFFITACYNTGAVSGTGTGSSVGGVAGSNDSSITTCHNTGAVSGDGNIGGVVGENSATITACYNTGAVSGTGVLGGVAGENSATITACYNTGTISGGVGVGGVAGESSGGGEITACYNTGAVSGSGNVGGVLGNGSGEITACYNTGAVSGSGNVGGVLGNGPGNVASNYWFDDYGDNADHGIGYPSSDTDATPFGPSAWPTITILEWQPGDNTANGSGPGHYWKSLGGWNGGNPDFPRLWYE